MARSIKVGSIASGMASSLTGRKGTAGTAPVAWPDAMLASYRTRNPEQAHWFDTTTAGEETEAELLSRLSSGYLYDTFGPDGQNRSVCDFVYVLRTTGNITSRTCTKTGDTLRWDVDGTVYSQNNLPAHTLGAGAGVVTVSSTDIWTGLTLFAFNTNNFIGGIPRICSHTALTVFVCNANQLTGSIPDLSANTALTVFVCDNNQLTGWDGGAVSITLGDFRAQTQNSPGTGLSQSDVDGILAAFDAAGRDSGTRILNLSGTNNAVPSAAGLTSKSNLEAKGWTVTVNS